MPVLATEVADHRRVQRDGGVLLDTAAAQIPGSPGEFAWGGVASTGFWIDRAEEISAVFFTQLTPSSAWPLRRELRVLAYQSLVD